ncbi:MAG TPA: hypothetical protein VM658_22165 [bacterium]|nr:hypothetical protein [bacterium]
MDNNDYLKNPWLWQASSAPMLAEKKPEELFDPAFAQRYKRLHENLFERITRAHNTLCAIEKIEQFINQASRFVEMEFWLMVSNNYVDILIVWMNGLLETGGDVHSLTSFHDEIMKSEWICDDKKQVLKKYLRDLNIDAKSLEKRVGEFRNNFIAHTLINKKTCGPLKPSKGVSLDELRKIFNQIHSQFGALSFGSTYSTLSVDMMPGKYNCLDMVINSVLKDNYFLNQPENNKSWPLIKTTLDSETIQNMNKLRKRIGLPEA